jgi:hypothetical protein
MRTYLRNRCQGAGGLPEMAAIVRGDQDKCGVDVVLHVFREGRSHFHAIESKAARGFELPCDLLVDLGKLRKDLAGDELTRRFREGSGRKTKPRWRFEPPVEEPSVPGHFEGPVAAKVLMFHFLQASVDDREVGAIGQVQVSQALRGRPAFATRRRGQLFSGLSGEERFGAASGFAQLTEKGIDLAGAGRHDPPDDTP